MVEPQPAKLFGYLTFATMMVDVEARRVRTRPDAKGLPYDPGNLWWMGGALTASQPDGEPEATPIAAPVGRKIAPPPDCQVSVTEVPAWW